MPRSTDSQSLFVRARPCVQHAVLPAHRHSSRRRLSAAAGSSGYPENLEDLYSEDRARHLSISRWRGTAVERQPLAGELSLSCARPAADG